MARSGALISAADRNSDAAFTLQSRTRLGAAHLDRLSCILLRPPDLRSRGLEGMDSHSYRDNCVPDSLMVAVPSRQVVPDDRRFLMHVSGGGKHLLRSAQPRKP